MKKYHFIIIDTALMSIIQNGEIIAENELDAYQEIKDIYGITKYDKVKIDVVQSKIKRRK